jgi:hypothetical protein
MKRLTMNSIPNSSQPFQASWLLIRRLNRRLAQSHFVIGFQWVQNELYGYKVRKAHPNRKNKVAVLPSGRRVLFTLGNFYLVDVGRNVIVQSDVTLEELATQVGLPIMPDASLIPASVSAATMAQIISGHIPAACA